MEIFKDAVQVATPGQHGFTIYNDDRKTLTVYVPKDCFDLVRNIHVKYIPEWTLILLEYKESPPASDSINHPAHYGGEDNPYEAIKVIEAWGLGFCLGNTVKYISRAGKKVMEATGALEDLNKARWYLDRQISILERYINGPDK